MTTAICADCGRVIPYVVGKLPEPGARVEIVCFRCAAQRKKG